MLSLQIVREAIYPTLIALCLTIAVIAAMVFLATGTMIALVIGVVHAIGAITVAFLPEDLPHHRA